MVKISCLCAGNAGAVPDDAMRVICLLTTYATRLDFSPIAGILFGHSQRFNFGIRIKLCWRLRFYISNNDRFYLLYDVLEQSGSERVVNDGMFVMVPAIFFR